MVIKHSIQKLYMKISDTLKEIFLYDDETVNETLIKDKTLDMNTKDFCELVAGERMAKVFRSLASVALFSAGVTIIGSTLIDGLYHFLKYESVSQCYIFRSYNIIAWIKALLLFIGGISYGKNNYIFCGSLSYLFGMYICNLTDRVLYFHDVSYLIETLVLIALVFGLLFEIRNLDFYIALVSGETLSILLVIVRSLFDEYLVDSIARFVFCLYKVPFVLFLIFLALEQKHRINCANIKKGY